MASALPVPPLITFEQYEAFEAPEGYRDELIHGRIVASPEAKPLHHEVAENIYALLKKFARKKHKVAQRMNLRFADAHSMPNPDVFVIHKKEWKRALVESVYPEGREVVLAVEVISPSNRPGPLKSKVDIDLKHGLEVWVADPKKREVRVSRPSSMFGRTPTKTFKGQTSIEWNGKQLPLATMFRLPK
jgi:Uma2 family endonuclease